MTNAKVISNNNIAILGCSYSGMLMALSLAHHGIASHIIEKQKCEKNFFLDPRTTSITYSSKNFLEQINIWPDLEPLSAAVKEIYILDNKNPDQLHLTNKERHNLGYMIANQDLKQSLFKLVKNHDLIKLTEQSGYDEINFISNQCQIKLSNQNELSTELTIVADGKNSLARSKYFPYLINKDYGQVAFVFNVEHAKAHENCAIEHFLPTGPFAILPLVSQNQSAIVWSVKIDFARAYNHLNHQDFTNVIQEIFGEFLGKIKIITPISKFNLSAQIVQNYFLNNMVLIGDSAHSIHPLAGQGLNQGMKDIQALSSIIMQCYSNNLNITHSELARYETMRKADNFKMFLATDCLDRVFSNNLQIVQVIRKTGFKVLNIFPGLIDKIIDYGIN